MTTATDIAIATATTAVQSDALRRSAPFTVPFSKLFLSPTNVRSKRQRSPAKIRELAAMIDVDGLLSDLQVSGEIDAKGKATGRYGVEAGGSRLLAIGLPVTAKKLAADVAVPCQLVEHDRATGVSLAENIIIQAMHPADEFVAFSALIAQGRSVDAVAAHFGVRAIEVERRMRLARVAPALFDQYREDKLSLDQLMALASTDDQKRQVAVWKSLPEYSRSASSIKRRLTEDEVKADDWRVKLIGLERYKASGGTLRADLFTEDTYLADAGLVDLVVAEVLAEAEAKLHAEGWAFVEVFETMGYEESQRFSKPPAKYLPETDAVRAKREAMETELESLEVQYEAIANEDSEDEDAHAAAQEKLEAIDRQCDQIRARLGALQYERLDTSGYDKTVLGAVVTTQAGVLKIMRGMMTAKEAKAEAHKQSAVKHGEVAGSSGAPAAAEFSEKLMADLTSHRTVAMQAALTSNAGVALVVLADRMYGQLAARLHGHSNADITVRKCRSALERDGTLLAESAAAKHLDAQAARWEAVVSRDSIARLNWLLAQPQATVLDLIAYCTALSINLVQRRASATEHANTVAGAFRLDMSDWWSVGVDDFLTHVSKAMITQVVTEACGASAAAPIGAMKKADACAKAAELLLETRWLPTPMRFGVAPITQASTATDSASVPALDTDAANDFASNASGAQATAHAA